LINNIQKYWDETLIFGSELPLRNLALLPARVKRPNTKIPNLTTQKKTPNARLQTNLSGKRL
jgi:hypothetical protein